MGPFDEVTLRIPESCQKKRFPLCSASEHLEVMIEGEEKKESAIYCLGFLARRNCDRPVLVCIQTLAQT